MVYFGVGAPATPTTAIPTWTQTQNSPSSTCNYKTVITLSTDGGATNLSDSRIIINQEPTNTLTYDVSTATTSEVLKVAVYREAQGSDVAKNSNYVLNI